MCRSVGMGLLFWGENTVFDIFSHTSCVQSYIILNKMQWNIRCRFTIYYQKVILPWNFKWYHFEIKCCHLESLNDFTLELSNITIKLPKCNWSLCNERYHLKMKCYNVDRRHLRLNERVSFWFSTRKYYFLNEKDW